MDGQKRAERALRNPVVTRIIRLIAGAQSKPPAYSALWRLTASPLCGSGTPRPEGRADQPPPDLVRLPVG